MGIRRRFIILTFGALLVLVGIVGGGAFSLHRADRAGALDPDHALSLVYPVSGPAGTDVAVDGSDCSSVAGHVEVFFAASNAPDTRLALAQPIPDVSGDWSTVLQIPDVDPTGAYFIGAQCWGDGFRQGLPGQQVEYFAYSNVPFTFADTVGTTVATVPTTTTTVPLGFMIDPMRPDHGPAGTVVTVSGSGCEGPSAAVDAYFATMNTNDTPIGAVVYAQPDADGDWTMQIVVPHGLDPADDNIVQVECNTDASSAASEVSFAVTASPTTTTLPFIPAPHHSGYAMLAGTGRVYAFGDLRGLGNAPGPAVAIAIVPNGTGYWITDTRGHVSHFGSARGYGGPPSLRAAERVSAISATPTGHGYWLFTNVGRAFTYGDAQNHGDLSHTRLNGPIVASAATPTGHGYYMVGSDGGVFTFGDAHFRGSTGNRHLNQPVVGVSPTPDNRGYWLVARDGGVFAFNAPFRGSMGSVRLNRPVDGLVAYGNGYLMGATDGGIFNFSNKPFLGSLATHPAPAPIVGISAFAS